MTLQRQHRAPLEQVVPPSTRSTLAVGEAVDSRASSEALDTWPLATAALLAFLFIGCLLHLGSFGLVSMEGMVANGGAAMLDGGNWAVPRVYGEIYTYKPALAYWLSALPQAVIDNPSPFWLRLPFALSGVMLGLGVFVLVGREVRPFAGLCAALATTGGTLFLEKIRLAEFDGVLAALVGLAVAQAIVVLARPRPSLGLWLGAYLALALGVFAKGALAPMVFGPGLIAAVVFTRQWRALFDWRHLAGVALFGGLLAAYLGWAVSLDGLAVLSQPGEEAGWRAIGWDLPSFGRTLLKPFMILVGFLPWSLGLALLPAALPSLAEGRRRCVLAALGFSVGGVLIFMAVPTHEMRYYMPLAASFGIVSGVLIGTREVAVKNWLAKVAVGVAVLGVVGAVAVAQDRGIGLAWWPVAAVAVAGLLWRMRVPRCNQLVYSLALCSVVAALFFSQVGLPGRAVKRDLTSIGERFAHMIPPNESVWALAPADLVGKHSSLFHRLGREVQTFTPQQPPPGGSFVVYVEERIPTLSDGSVLPLETLDSVQHAYFHYRLARVPAAFER